MLALDPHAQRRTVAAGQVVNCHARVVEGSASSSRIGRPDIHRRAVRTAHRAGTKWAGRKPHLKLPERGCPLIHHGAVGRDLDDIGGTVLLTGCVVEGEQNVLRPGILSVLAATRQNHRHKTGHYSQQKSSAKRCRKLSHVPHPQEHYHVASRSQADSGRAHFTGAGERFSCLPLSSHRT